MKYTRIALLVAASAATLRAQTQPADPISGRWTGYIGRSEASPSGVTVELKRGADGLIAGTVTGPQITPGDIKGGTFDATTGAVKFTVVIRSNAGSGGNVTFDGRLSNDSLAGKLSLNGEAGVFKLTKSARVSQAGGAPAKATRTHDDEAATAIKRGFVEVSDWITRAADMVPPDKYSYRPVNTVRTFGQVIGHVVDGSQYYCGRGAGKNVQWSDQTEKSVTTKSALTQALKKAFADCAATFDNPNQIGPLTGQLGHLSLHYGNIVTYMRMLGMTPPSS
jgi:hypothetical protein